MWWTPEQACRRFGKDLNSAELETVRVSQNPTKEVTASGEVQTKEEVTVHVRELDLFVTVLLLEDTPAVLSLGKLCEDDGYNNHWTSGQKPHFIFKNGRRAKMQHGELRAIRCPWSIDRLFKFIGFCSNSVATFCFVLPVVAEPQHDDARPSVVMNLPRVGVRGAFALELDSDSKLCRDTVCVAAHRGGHDSRVMQKILLDAATQTMDLFSIDTDEEDAPSALVNEFVASAHVIEYVASAPVTTVLESPILVVHDVQFPQVQVVQKTIEDPCFGEVCGSNTCCYIQRTSASDRARDAHTCFH